MAMIGKFSKYFIGPYLEYAAQIMQLIMVSKKLQNEDNRMISQNVLGLNWKLQVLNALNNSCKKANLTSTKTANFNYSQQAFDTYIPINILTIIE